MRYPLYALMGIISIPQEREVGFEPRIILCNRVKIVVSIHLTLLLLVTKNTAEISSVFELFFEAI